MASDQQLPASDMSMLHTLLRATTFRSPLLSAFVPSVAAAAALQAAAAVPSVLARSERFYDVSGSATFVAVAALSLYLPPLRARAAGHILKLPSPAPAFGGGGSVWFNWRQVALTATVVVWAVRLGSYLFRRVLAEGKDSRFDGLRGRPRAFSLAFVAQAAWVVLMLSPVLALNAVPAAALSALPAVTLADAAGLGVWAAGLALEAAADAQKSRWVRGRRLKLHDEEFLTKGLFSRCRYPNYLGEITLWTGVAVVAAGALAQPPVQLALGFGGWPAGVAATTALCLASPATAAYLLTRVTGIPLSEAKYDKRFGGRKDYQAWKRDTPRLLPKLW